MSMLRAWMLVCLWLPVLASAANKQASKEELASIEQSIGKVQKEISALNHQRDSVGSDVLASEHAISLLMQKIEGLTTAIAADRGTLTQLQAQSIALQKQRSSQQELMASYIRSAWVNGNQEFLKLLLKQQTPADATRMSRYYHYFAEARTEAINKYTRLLQQIDSTQTQVTAATAHLAQQQNDMQAQRNQLAEQQARRQSLLASLNADLTDRSKKLNSLEQERVEIQLLMEELQRRSKENLSKTDPFVASKGRLPWPVEGKIQHSFGTRYELGDLNYEGVVMSAAIGADIKAIHHGRVVFADWFGSSGLLLIIDHGDGYMSLYAHNRQLYQKLGSWVQRGDVIAAVGNTGGQSQSGLYFEIRHDGKAENPALWCLPHN